MTDVSIVFRECLAKSKAGVDLRYTVFLIVAPTIWLSLVAYTVKKYRKHISNKWLWALMASWTLEYFIYVVFYVQRQMSVDKKENWVIRTIRKVLFHSNVLMFIAVIFNLLLMEIYLSPQNNTEEKIRRKVQRHKVQKLSYTLFYVVSAIFNETVTSFVYPELMNSNPVDAIYFTISLLDFLVKIGVQVLILRAVFRMQEQMRNFGHKTGYLAERLVICSYAAYFGRTFYLSIFRPSLVLAISRSGYKCPSAMQNLVILLHWWNDFRSLPLQLLFIGLIW